MTNDSPKLLNSTNLAGGKKKERKEERKKEKRCVINLQTSAFFSSSPPSVSLALLIAKAAVRHRISAKVFLVFCRWHCQSSRDSGLLPSTCVLRLPMMDRADVFADDCYIFQQLIMYPLSLAFFFFFFTLAQPRLLPHLLSLLLRFQFSHSSCSSILPAVDSLVACSDSTFSDIGV